MSNAYVGAAASRGRSASAAVTDVLLLGPGSVGCAVLEQLAPLRDAGLRVTGVVDRRGALLSARGFDAAELHALIALKRSGAALDAAPGAVAAPLETLLGRFLASTAGPKVVVDTTAMSSGPLVLQALAGGCDVVLANKIPLVGDQASVRAIASTAAIHGRRVRHEATVGAGLPVIETIARLEASGDTIVQIEGCPSGTLGFVFAEVARGVPFSVAVRAAHEAGYTEPDPRCDLSGLDVARKALILARCLGFEGELTDLAVEALVPPQFGGASVEAFFEALPALDAAWAERSASAAAAGAVLRYRVRVTPRAVQVGVVEVPRGGALGALQGTDNQFAFTTARYAERPLVITGPGAGAAVTAAGVVGDVLALLR